MRARRDLNPRPSALLISDRGPTLLSVLSYGPGQGARRTIVQIAYRPLIPPYNMIPTVNNYPMLQPLCRLSNVDSLSCWQFCWEAQRVTTYDDCSEPHRGHFGTL